MAFNINQDTINALFQGQSFQNFAKAWAADPVSVEQQLHDLVLSQVGTNPRPDPMVYKNCGDFFLRPQTCGSRDGLEQKFYVDLALYSEKYYSTRAGILGKVKAALGVMPVELTRPLFVQGVTKIAQQAQTINQQLVKAGLKDGLITVGLQSLPTVGQILQVFSLFQKQYQIDQTKCGRLFPPPFELIRDPQKGLAGIPQFVACQVLGIYKEQVDEFRAIQDELFPELSPGYVPSGTFGKFFNINPITIGVLAVIVILLALAWKKSK